VDLDVASDRGVGVCNITAYCTDSVVQHVFALIFSLNQHLAGYQKLLQDGAWRDSPQFCLLDYEITELKGKTLGIVGYGELGRGTARMGKALGMNVIISARPKSDASNADPDRVPFDELLARADIISIHSPLTADTEELFGAAQFRRMKETALIINTARGAIIDEQALADALRVGEIGGAGIDVLSEEPPVDGNPLLDRDIPNLIITPHIAWAAREARQRAVDEMAANVKDFLAGGRRGRVV
jgi:glycerate dehydrogenase